MKKTGDHLKKNYLCQYTLSEIWKLCISTEPILINFHLTFSNAATNPKTSSDGNAIQNEEGLLSNSTTDCTSVTKVRFVLYQLEIRWLYNDEFYALYTVQYSLLFEHNVF
jgi:hypothetical protein